MLALRALVARALPLGGVRTLMRSKEDQVFELRQPRRLLVQRRPLLPIGGRRRDRAPQLVVRGFDHQQHQLTGLEHRLGRRWVLGGGWVAEHQQDADTNRCSHGAYLMRRDD